MDTKLRKFKYSFFTKFLCWLIAITLFCLSFTVAVKIIFGCYVMGPENYFKGNPLSLYETNVFLTQFQSDFFDAHAIGTVNSNEYKEKMNSQKETIVGEALSDFLTTKAVIIEQELTFAVDNWDAEYYAYEDEVEEVDDVVEDATYVEATQVAISDNVSETEVKLTLPADADEYVGVPHFAPKNIKLASYALNTESGKGYIKYEALVRDSAFEGSFYKDGFTVDTEGYNGEFPVFAFEISYKLSENEAKKEIERQFDNQVEASVVSYNQAADGAKSRLEDRVNLKYYIVDFDGNVFSNIKEIPTNLSNNKYYVLSNEENVTVKGFSLSNLEKILKHNNVKKLCLYFDESFKGSDVYGNIVKSYNTVTTDNVNKLIIELVALLVLFIIMLVVWLRLIGNRKYSQEPKLCFIEKIPNDLHTILSCGALCGLVFIYGAFFFDIYDAVTFHLPQNMVIICAFLVLCLAVITEWLSSVVRTKKAGESYFKNTVIYKLFKCIAKLLRKLVKVFEYKPKAFKLRFIILFAGYILANVLIVSFAVACTYWGPVLAIIIGIFCLIFNVGICYLLVDYINNLDRIIVASSENENVVFKRTDIPKSLKILANNLTVKNEALDKAVAEAIKKEHMKTQLITNVSHDLKTPLTSLISYSDLLSKCDIEDEDAKKYVDVINQQSEKLKRLIEDLIEASKVSTGNVTLNKVKLNLSELAVQAIVEFTPDFEKNCNEVKFSEPETPPVVFADGTKTYRIISNLLSNAKKYSAPHTRIYASVYQEGDYGCFEIKNISKEPLNISASELTERFVRGDESRTNEGNGLGLSIAKDLCTLQNGKLDIIIDGDLFKVIVKLPVNE